MEQGYFITGTDTDSGKTVATLGLMQLLQSQGLQVAGMKPVAAGADETGEGLRNSDALQIQAQSSRMLPYEWVNPYLFEPPIAPHLAAEQSRVEIDIRHIENRFRQLAAESDCVVVEGAGGWLVPLGADSSMADLALRLEIPVILVVGLKLGCINHALLTALAIRNAGAVLAGWIGSRVDPHMREPEGNIATLSERLDTPCLGIIPHLPNPVAEAIGRHLTTPR